MLLTRWTNYQCPVQLVRLVNDVVFSLYVTSRYTALNPRSLFTFSRNVKLPTSIASDQRSSRFGSCRESISFGFTYLLFEAKKRFGLSVLD